MWTLGNEDAKWSDYRFVARIRAQYAEDWETIPCEYTSQEIYRFVPATRYLLTVKAVRWSDSMESPFSEIASVSIDR